MIGTRASRKSRSWQRAAVAMLSLLIGSTQLVAAASAADASASADPPAFDPQPQTITFSLPATGYVGAAIPLGGTASSGLEVTYASLTPAICSTDGTTLALATVGTCTVRASQAGNADDWLPAPDIDASMAARLSPFVTDDGANLGRYALNGGVLSMAIDPATGTTYIGGDFSEIGVRSGSVVHVHGPASGLDTVKPGTPDVIGSELLTFPDDATGYFVTGHIGSVNGDGVLRDHAIRMTTAGQLDPSWSLGTTCGTSELPNWARNRIQWDLGDVLVTNINMAPTTSGDSTIGLAFIDKASGVARRTGAGDATCGSGGRIWPGTPVFAPLSSCAAWLICFGFVTDVVKDPGSNSLIVTTSIRRGQTSETQERPQTWLMAYDLTSGARKWATRLESSTAWEAHVRGLVGLGGSVLIRGLFPLESAGRPNPEITVAMLVDVATGTILQRWNELGEQDVANPLGPEIAAPMPCTPVADLEIHDVWRYTSLDAGRAVGYGKATGGGNSSRTYPVCEVAVTGSGLSARLTATSLGTLVATRGQGNSIALPSAIADDHYLVGAFGGFDLDTGTQLAQWHPAPSAAGAMVAVAGSTIVIVNAKILDGVPAFHVAALDKDLAPVPGFQSGLLTPTPSEDWFRGMVRSGDQLVVIGQLLGPDGPSHMIALDRTTGAVEWTAPTTANTWTLDLASDPATGDVYVAMEGNAASYVRRYVRSGSGFAEDTSFTHTFTGLTTLYGVQTAVTAVDWIGGRLYVGGFFTAVDGQPRQGLARFGSDGALDGWAPKLIDEMGAPDGAPMELSPQTFLEVGGNVVVTGGFAWYGPYDGGYPTYSATPIRIYKATTGALVRPLNNLSWFGSTDGGAITGAGATAMGGIVYVALGGSGVAAFDATTFDYLPYLSVRTFNGWGANAVYALATRPVTGTATPAMPGSGSSAATPAASSLVFGGQVPRWQNHTASNVVELGPGALNSDHAAPTVSAVTNRPRSGGSFVGSSAPWTVAWTGKDTGGSGVARYELSQSRNGGSWTVVSVSLKTAAASVAVVSGSTYRFRVRPVDRAGNVGAWAYGATFRVAGVQQSSSAVRYAGTWTTSTSTSTTWWGGTARSSSRAGSTASYTFTGRSIAWVGLRGLGRGKANVYVNGVLRATVDLYSSTTLKQRIVWSTSYSTSATRTVTIKVLGTSGRPRVDVDGFVVGS